MIIILLSFYFHEVLEQLKNYIFTNFHFWRVLRFVIEYAWLSDLLRETVFTSAAEYKHSCSLQRWVILGILLS